MFVRYDDKMEGITTALSYDAFYVVVKLNLEGGFQLRSLFTVDENHSQVYILQRG